MDASSIICMRSEGIVKLTFSIPAGSIGCSAIKISIASKTDWIGDPTHHFLIDALSISKTSPSRSTNLFGWGASAKHANNPRSPVSGSGGEVIFDLAKKAEYSPSRAPLPPNTNAFSM